MRYLVTGAAGFIGSHLTEALLGDGHDVVAIDCFTPYYDPALKHRNSSGFTVLNRDLATSPIDAIAATVDGIFHLAGQPGVGASWGDKFDAYAQHNILATQRVFEAAAKQDVRVVFASSSSVYGDSASYPTSESAAPS